MGARGVAPKPSYLRVLEGNPSKRPFNPNEAAVPTVKALKAPISFPDAKVKIWNEICHELAVMGGLSTVDRQMLILYVDTLAECQRLIAKIDELADTVIPVYGKAVDAVTGKPIPIGMKSLPYALQLKQQKELALRFANHFGMTPSARARIVFLGAGGTGADPGAGDADQPDSDEFDD